jgi:DNA-binding winged helix-turn-helix (wHTH) protein/predicted ATPase/type II secretory pathway predicted ATPase ExeA
MDSSTPILFPPFRLDLMNEQLWRGKRVLSLKPKTFAVLRYLAERAGQLVTKEQLLDALWAEVHVGDAVLKVCLREIRAALGDDARNPRFIETIHRRGYRFIAPLRMTQSESSRQKAVSRREAAAEDEEKLPPADRLPPSVLVGREVELTQLHLWLQKALSGERQIVFVTGEAGLGKTTLMEGFLSQLSNRTDLWIARGQCLEQYGPGEAYLPVLDAFGQLCREPGGMRVVEALGQYAPTWLVQMPALLGAAELKTLRHRVMGATRERMLREMAEAVEMLTKEQALVLWVDDLHWCDYATLDLMSYLARRSQPARLLILGAYRPVDVILQEHPLRRVKQDLLLHGLCEEMALESLTEEAVGAYLLARFGAEGMREPVRRRLANAIHRRTEGNPLFIVNVTDYLLTQHAIVERDGQWEVIDQVGDVAVPLNIRQFLEQQIEQLSPRLQRILGAASIAGMEGAVATVAAALGEEVEEVERHCVELAQRGQFLRAKEVSEWPDGTVTARYGFLHALYQEVLYNRLPISQRIGFHRRIGERLESAYGARTTEAAAELALHFEQGRDAQRAVQYLQQAAENAIQRSAPQEASLHLTKAVELLKTLPDTPERTQQELGLQLLLGTQLSTSKGFGAPEAAHAYARARALCEQIGDSPQRFMALGGLFTFHLTRAELQTAHELAEQLLNLAQTLQFGMFELWAHLCLGIILHAEGEPRSAHAHLERSIALYDPQLPRSPAIQDPGVLSLSQAAETLWLLGYPEQAVRRSQEAITLARRISHPFSLAHAFFSAAKVQQLARDQQATRQAAEELFAFATEQGFAVHAAGGMILQGWALIEEECSTQGVTQIRQGLAVSEEAGTVLRQPYVLALLAEAHRKNGRADEGLKVLIQALALVDSTGERWWEAELYRLYGELTLQNSF